MFIQAAINVGWGGGGEGKELEVLLVTSCYETKDTCLPDRPVEA